MVVTVQAVLQSNGSLNDGLIPNIDTTQQRWARELFTVNHSKNGQNSFVIGFQFSSPFILRNVEVAYLDCPVWGIGLLVINVYSSHHYPAFLTAASTNIGMLSLAETTDQSCTSLRTVSIPLQAILFTEIYFVEFTSGGSSVQPINWLHLAEIRFGDVAPIMVTTLGK